ncbi:hypothetical protein FKW77_006808 [Venturia effusa]|uniref:Uncharacterized protein n=1 Tax=Venturia effusa TaxID=50376 RepID=A0A517LLR1_9PEZI|nr:hypothetical protein FKW77_006808 [Venturia effusa]
MSHLPNAVPFPERCALEHKPAIGSEVIHKQLVQVIEHRTSVSMFTEAAESSPTSSYATAPEQTGTESESPPSSCQGPPIKNAPDVPQFDTTMRKNGDKPAPTFISSSFLRDFPENHKPPARQAQEVPVYPMNKHNIKPYEVWVDTKGVPLKYYSFAFLTQDQNEYVKELQANWNNASVPPIRPEAPLGTTLHKAINSHCLETMERVPPGQAWKISNNHCINIIQHWEMTLSKIMCDPVSAEAIERDSSIQRCRELREELLAQRSNVEEMVSTKLLLARAVWEHEAFKQIRKERSRIEGLEAELAKVKSEKAAYQNALLDEVEKQQSKGDVHNLNAYVQLLGNENKENTAIMLDWNMLNRDLSGPKQQPANPLKLTQAFAMIPRLVSYVEKRASALEQEKVLLSKFVDVRPIRNDKANLIGVTIETIVHDALAAKADIEIKLRALNDQMASQSTASSPGLSGLPPPPPGATHDSQEDMVKRIEALEVETSIKAYEGAVALTFSKYWKTYCPYKTAKDEFMGLSDDEDEDFDDGMEEQEYEDDPDYEENPCAKLTEAQVATAAENGTSCVPLPNSPANSTNITSPSGAHSVRTMQWFYDVMSHACQSWTQDVVRHRNALQKRQRENERYEKSLANASELLKKQYYRNVQAGKENQKLRSQNKELEARVREYTNLTQRIGIESDKDLRSGTSLYNSLQSLTVLKDENLRLKALIDGLNDRVADLIRTLDIYEGKTVPRPSANHLEESLAESMQVYDHKFSNHKFWLRNLTSLTQDSSIDEEKSEQAANSVETTAIPAFIHDDGDGGGDVSTDGLAMLKAMAEDKPIPDLKAHMLASPRTSPERHNPSGPYDEHSIKDLDISESVNETKAWRARGGGYRDADDQLSKEIQAMSGLVQLKEGRNTKFSERFEEFADETEGFSRDVRERRVDNE